MGTTPFLTGKTLARFEALQHRLVPCTVDFDDHRRATGLALVNQLTGQMPPANRRKLNVFLIAIDAVSVAMGGRAFRNLSAERQQRVLQWLFDCPIGLLRKGFWGLNTLAKLSAYGQESMYAEIGYQTRENPHD